jgi:glutathione S-transferase
MRLYSGAESGNSWKIRILLEQLDVPYEEYEVFSWSTFVPQHSRHPRNDTGDPQWSLLADIS